MNPKYQVQDIMKWNPCYILMEVQELIGDGKEASEIAGLDIPTIDVAWCLIRMLCDIKSKKSLIEFLTECIHIADEHIKENKIELLDEGLRRDLGFASNHLLALKMDVDVEDSTNTEATSYATQGAKWARTASNNPSVCWEQVWLLVNMINRKENE